MRSGPFTVGSDRCARTRLTVQLIDSYEVSTFGELQMAGQTQMVRRFCTRKQVQTRNAIFQQHSGKFISRERYIFLDVPPHGLKSLPSGSRYEETILSLHSRVPLQEHISSPARFPFQTRLRSNFGRAINVELCSIVSALLNFSKYQIFPRAEALAGTSLREN